MNIKLQFILQLVLLFSFLTAHSQNVTENGIIHRPLKDYGLQDYVNVTKTLPHSENQEWRLVCKLPYNAQFQPWIEVEAPSGKVIKFDSTNPLVPAQFFAQQDTTVSGIKSYEAPKWISGEGACYTIPAGVTVRAVKYRETGYDTKFVGSFLCNDNDYNILWQKASRTAYLCMREHYMDCPDRERSEWLGDAVLEMEEGFYIFDTNANAIAKNLLLSKQINDLPGQNLIAHGEFGEWNYYMYTGDLPAISAIYSSTKEYLDRYKIGSNGLPVHRAEGWDWYDWGVGTTDTEVIQVAEYYTAINALKKMAKVTGHDADIPAIDEKLNSIKANFDKVFWKGDGYRSGNEPDERANAMAVVAGLADPSRWSIISGILETKMNCGPYFERWVLEALCKMKKPDQALLRMYNRYKYQIQSGFTTLWEYIERSFENTSPWSTDSDEYLSLNHAWNTPNLILSKFIAGVAPETPGWDIYHVFPQEAFLTSVKVKVPTVKGMIQANIQKEKKQYKIELVSPLNTSAIVGIPQTSFSTLVNIKVNGKLVWDGAFKNEIKGVSWIGEDSGYIKFKVEPGTWNFVASGTLPVTTPKQAPIPSTDVKLDKKAWTVSAFLENKEYKLGCMSGSMQGKFWPVNASAETAIDEDFWTGWRAIDPKKPLSESGHFKGQQTPGQWFIIDLKKAQPFHKIVLDNTWALYDYPKSYEVYVSNDGISWGTSVASGAGELGITTIVFPQKTARYIKIVQTGTKDKPWSVFEVDIYRKGSKK
jgi:alpha-L-rhamnosidase